MSRKRKTRGGALRKIAAVILCGGESKRMQQDKSYLSFGATYLLEYQYQRLKEWGFFAEVFISSKKNQKGIWGDNIFIDNIHISSPLSGLKTILECSPYDEHFIITVDSPFVSAQSVHEIMCNEQAYDILAFCDSQHKHHLIGIYKKTALKGIVSMIQHKIYRLQEMHRFVNIKYFFCNKIEEFTNLNTLEDYILAQQRL